MRHNAREDLFSRAYVIMTDHDEELADMDTKYRAGSTAQMGLCRLQMMITNDLYSKSQTHIMQRAESPTCL